MLEKKDSSNRQGPGLDFKLGFKRAVFRWSLCVTDWKNWKNSHDRLKKLQKLSRMTDWRNWRNTPRWLEKLEKLTTHTAWVTKNAPNPRLTLLSKQQRQSDLSYAACLGSSYGWQGPKLVRKFRKRSSEQALFAEKTRVGLCDTAYKCVLFTSLCGVSLRVMRGAS